MQQVNRGSPFPVVDHLWSTPHIAAIALWKINCKAYCGIIVQCGLYTDLAGYTRTLLQVSFTFSIFIQASTVIEYGTRRSLKRYAQVFTGL